MSTFERYLSVWVVLCIIAGVTLGYFLPGVFQAIGGSKIVQVNLPVAILIWLMIIPMLVKIDFAALGQVREHWRGIGVTLFINWGVKPFSVAALATVVGVLVEVPVMLSVVKIVNASVVKIVNASKAWYERSPAVQRNGQALTWW